MAAPLDRLDLGRIDHLTFDCYGTLIDWETGLLRELHRILAAHGRTAHDAALLEAYARLEAEAERPPYRPYRAVLQEVLRGIGERFGFTPGSAELDAFPDTIATWEPFPDTVPALRRLASRYGLVVISNIDDDLFAHTAAKLQVPFRAVITAQQVGSYKPAPENFRAALDRLGVGPERVLHCAESRFHDVAPARRLGITTVWVNRHAARPGPSASGASDAVADLEVPDMQTLADRLL